MYKKSHSIFCTKKRYNTDTSFLFLLPYFNIYSIPLQGQNKFITEKVKRIEFLNIFHR